MFFCLATEHSSMQYRAKCKQQSVVEVDSDMYRVSCCGSKQAVPSKLYPSDSRRVIRDLAPVVALDLSGMWYQY